MRIFRILAFFLATIVPSPGLPQQTKCVNIKAAEEALVKILQEIHNSSLNERERLESEFEREFLAVLRDKASFTYPFPKLSIHIADSSDGKLRLYTWDTALGGTHHLFAGIVQWIDESDKLHTKPLEDVSAASDSDPDNSQNEWIGALYSEVHPLPFKGTTYYLAIGWTTWGGGTETKVVEILEPRENDIYIGKPIFELEGRRRSRLLFTYARKHRMRLTYYPKPRILRFENLIEPISQPEEEPPAGWYWPDGTFRELQFRGNCFREIKRQIQSPRIRRR